MPRLFVAIDLPHQVQEELEGLQHGLPGVRWTPVEQLHLTLKFIGEVPPRALERIRELLDSVQGEPFDLSLHGVGQFSRKGMQPVLWIGVKNPEPLQNLQTQIERVLVPEEIPKEKRRFVPHITIARVKQLHHERMENYMKEFSHFESSVFRVEDFHLFSSTLQPAGAIHRIEKTRDLIDLPDRVSNHGPEQ